MTIQELYEQAERDPFNDVSVIKLESGELVLFLSHRVSLDNAVMVRVRSDEDIIPMYDKLGELTPDYNEVNEGGDWPGDSADR